MAVLRVLAPFLAIVAIAPFKFGALIHAVTSQHVVCRHSYGPDYLHVQRYGLGQRFDHRDGVERPQRTYPRAMPGAMDCGFELHCASGRHVDDRSFRQRVERVFWADIAGLLGGPLLRVGLALGGMISGFGMFNALVMSYSRLPLAMAQDGMLPRVFGKLHPRSRAPWVAIVVCAIGWALCLGLGFERLVTIDILLYGVSLGLSLWLSLGSAFANRSCLARSAFLEESLERSRSVFLPCCCSYSLYP